MIWACCFRAEYVLALKRAEDEKEGLDAKVIKDYKAKKLKESVPLRVQIREDKKIELPPTKQELEQ